MASPSSCSSVKTCSGAPTTPMSRHTTRRYDSAMNTQKIPAGAAKPAQDAPSVFNKPIALVGLMGSGKSAVGRRLAKQLGLTFADSDQLVTKMAGVSITDIFDLAGEAKFRDMEFRAIQKQLQKPPHVLATGGGAFANSKQPPCCATMRL